MSAASNHLAEIYRQLRDRFSADSIIVVTPIKGDPPDQYEITYNLKGLSKPGSGNVIDLFDHTIELTIPFGFPHFPPSCKPKSHTFHPDFDPAAICLGEFWNQDSQLPDLIIHIGQLINGEIYSTTNAFNEDAASWYITHPEIFPLAEIQWREAKPDHNDSGKTGQPIIDILDDSELSTHFDFLALDDVKVEEDLAQESTAPVAQPVSTIDPNLVHLLESQRNYFAISEILKSALNHSEELQQLSLKTEERVREAADLYREVKKFEKRGESQKALAALEQVLLIAADYPDIETHLNRLRQSLDPADVPRSLPDDSPPEVAETPFSDEKMSAGKTSAKSCKNSSPENRMQLKHHEKKPLLHTSGPRRRLLSYVLGGVISASIAGCGYYYLNATNKIGSAENAYSRCLASVKNQLFKEAKQGCEEALATSQEVIFFHRTRTSQLRNNINQLLQSERFIQGLNGKILVDGKFLANKDAETINTIRRLQKEANDFILQENWRQANDRFVEILDTAKTEATIPAEIVEEIKEKHGIAQFRMIYAAAELSLQNDKWPEAITEISKAESFLSYLSEVDRLQYTVNLQKMLVKSTFEKLREQGDALFAESDWLQSIATYQHALSTFDDTAESLSEQSLEAVRRNIKRAELYHLIDQGNRDFGSGTWDEALANYRRAETFLIDHQGLLSTDDAQQNLRKLSRVILQTQMVLGRQSAKRHLENNELVAAAKAYRQLIEYIKNSSFSGESEFRETMKEITATIHTLNEQIHLADKTQYLKDEYRTIFIASYPNAIIENLINPTISLTRDTGDKMIFKLQCTESGERPLTLILNYAFDKKSGQWELFSEQP